MSLNHSPAVVTNGLVMYYDMGNTKKSWKGAPTTNLITYPDASYNNGAFVLGYNYANNGVTYTYLTGVSNPVNAPGVMQYFTGNSDYKYFSVGSTAVPTTGTYTFSYYARIISGPSLSNNLNNSQLWRDNVIGDQAVTGDWNPTFTSEWKRYTTTGPVQAGSVLQYFLIHSGLVTGGYTIQYCGFQMELSPYATPYVNGSRTNTQALLDLTNNNTLTASSLTYASDNTFSFNNTASQRINTGYTTALTDFTIAVWFKSTGNGGGYDRLIDKQYNTGTMLMRNAALANSWGGGVIEPNAPYGIFLTLADNQWHYLVSVRSGTTHTLYGDGITNTVSNTVSASALSIEPLTIGNWSSQDAQRFIGSVSSVQVYNKALSASEVSQNFNALRGRFGI